MAVQCCSPVDRTTVAEVSALVVGVVLAGVVFVLRLVALVLTSWSDHRPKS